MLPPRRAEQFLHWFLREELAEEVAGDLEEKFLQVLRERGPLRARLNYWYQVFHYLRPFALGIHLPQPLIHLAMYKHNFLITYRNLIKQKSFAVINIGGLAVGMAVALLLGLWLFDEVSFDQYHGKRDRVAQVMQNQTFSGEIKTDNGVPKPLGPVLKETYGSHFAGVAMTSWVNQHYLSVGEKHLEKRGLFSEEDLPDILSLDLVEGQIDGLEDPSSILISASAAQALFPNTSALDQSLQLNYETDLRVAGVYRDLPDNSSFAEVDFFAAWEVYEKDLPDWISWGNNWFQLFVELKEGQNMAAVSEVIREAKIKHIDEDHARYRPELFLHSMSQWHLYSDFKGGKVAGGRIQYVWMFGIIGVFILLLACINFMNLSTARSEKRAREVGIRKAIGSKRGQLIRQFFFESVFITFLSFLVALLLAQLALPWFNELAEKNLHLLVRMPAFWGLGLGFCLIVGLLAGSYPALYLSSFDPVKVLKGKFQPGKRAALPRQILVVGQFTISVCLIIGTLIVFRQIQFAKDRPIGYEQSRLVHLYLSGNGILDHFDPFRDEVLKTGLVENLALSESPVTNSWTTNSGLDWRGKDPAMQDEFVTMRVSHDFGQTVGWHIKEGRDFSRDFQTDTMGLILNEAAVAYMGFENPIGEKVEWGENETMTVIGVVDDLLTQSPYAPVRQGFFFMDKRRIRFLTIKLAAHASTEQALAMLEEKVTSYDPAYPFDYNFVDQSYANKFGEEERIGNLAGAFTLLAILISCLGLFGLASYIAEQRTKEIGIRKVLGASTRSLWQLLSREFIILVTISSVVAIPLAYFLGSNWLENFLYRAPLDWWLFAGAIGGALFLTLLTVSFQAIKAATANPIHALRSE